MNCQNLRLGFKWCLVALNLASNRYLCIGCVEVLLFRVLLE